MQIPEHIPEENIVLENVHSSMGLSRNIKMDLIVLVESDCLLSNALCKKDEGSTLDQGTVNWKNKGQNKHMR